MRHRIKGQSTLEYAMVITCIAGALIAMQFYVKRSIQGRVRNAADELGEQYSAKTTTSQINQTFSSNTRIEGDPLIVDGLPDPDMSRGPLSSAETTEMYNYLKARPQLKQGDSFLLSTGRLIRIEKREFVATKRTEGQTLTQNAGNYEQTGKFEDKLFD